MSIKEWLIRPSTVMHDIEDGFLLTGQMLTRAGGGVASIVVKKCDELARKVRTEVRARKLADAAMVSVELSNARSEEEMHDLHEIERRTKELLLARMSRKVA